MLNNKKSPEKENLERRLRDLSKYKPKQYQQLAKNKYYSDIADIRSLESSSTKGMTSRDERKS